MLERFSRALKAGASAFKAQAASSGVANPAQWFIDWAGGTPASSGIRVDINSALTSVPVQACVRILAEDCAKLPITIWKWKLKPGGGRDSREEFSEHPIWRLLALKPNRWQTAWAYRAMMVSQYCVSGNAIAVIYRGLDGRPTDLVPVESYNVSLFISKETGQLFYDIDLMSDLHRYLFGGEKIRVTERDVVHVKFPITYQGGFWGKSPILLGKEAIGNALAVDQYAGRLFVNDASIGGVITRPPESGTMTPEAVQKFMAQWRERYAGTANRGKTPLLQEGMQFQKIDQMSADDAQYIESRRFSIEEAARIFRIPPFKLMSLERAIQSNIYEQSQNYADDTISPIISNFEAEYTDKLLMGREATYIDIEHDLSIFFRGRPQDRYEVYKSGIQWGIMSPNEARMQEGLNARKGGDEYWTPANMVVGDKPEPKVPQQVSPVTTEQEMNNEALRLLKSFNRESPFANGH